MHSNLRLMPSLRNDRVCPYWINGTSQYLCYVYGEAVLKRGKVARFRSKETARKAGETYLAYCAQLAGA